MEIKKTNLKDVYVFTPEVFEDERGFFMRFYSKDEFEKFGINVNFVQDNLSRSKKNVIRGLHFQWDPPLGKLIRIPRGSAFAVSVDIRKKSETFGKWFGIELSEDNKKLIYVPAGIAAGFLTLKDITDVHYKYTVFYNSKGESNIFWNDPKIGINWPIETEPIISERDKNAQSFEQWLERPESDNF